MCSGMLLGYRQKDSGKNMAELFAQNGVGLLRASNNRVQGWAAEKEMLKPLRGEKDRPGLLVTSNCRAPPTNCAVIVPQKNSTMMNAASAARPFDSKRSRMMSTTVTAWNFRDKSATRLPKMPPSCRWPPG